MLTRRTLLSSLATLPIAAAKLSPSDDALLEDLSRRSFRYFWEQSDPSTGITPAGALASTPLLTLRNAATWAAPVILASASLLSASERNANGSRRPKPPHAAGSLTLPPDISIPALRAMKDRFGDRIYGRYGFADAFHPTTNWVADDVIGLDLGHHLLSAESLRTGNVWKWFMASPEA
jgi:hypothetical protein